MRQTTVDFNTEETIENISNLIEVELEEIPHYDTINEVFEKIDIEELRRIQKYMVKRLIRSKMFDKYRYNGKYFQIIISGDALYTCEPVITTGIILRLKEDRLKLLGKK